LELRLIRQLLGRGVERFEALIQPAKPAVLLADLSLYHYPACPFHIKVRRAMGRHHVAVELRDIDTDRAFGTELMAQGGKTRVPCLRIETGQSVRGLYESDAIISYLGRCRETGSNSNSSSSSDQ
jgi:glutaredoxin 2